MKKLLNFLIIFISQLVVAQNTSVENYRVSRDVQANSDLNTGLLKLNIPLYDINNLLKSSLSYSSDLNNIKNDASIVGNNWNFNGIGKIMIEYPQSSNKTIFGMNDLIASHNILNQIPALDFNRKFCYKTINNIPKYDILNNPSLLGTTYNPFFPVRFNFNFLDHSGYFIFDNNGNVVISSETGIIKVEISEQNICQYIYKPIQPFEVVLTDNKNNKYIFGGSRDEMDIAFSEIYYYTNFNNYTGDLSNPSYQIWTKVRTNYINSLSLREIHFSNNEKIFINYKKSLDFDNKYLEIPIIKSSKNEKMYPYNIPEKDFLKNSNTFLEVLDNGFYNDQRTYKYSGTTLLNDSYFKSDTKINSKIAIVDNILFNDYKVKYYYKLYNNKLTKPFITKIEISNQNKIINRLNFIYNTNIHKNATFLEKLRIDSLQEYNFDYYKDFPSSDSQLIYSQAGLLKEFYTPFLGKEEYIYENNKVLYINKEIKYNNNGGLIMSSKLHKLKEPKIIDGTRIKKIIKSSSEIEYEYLNDNGEESGILEYAPDDTSTPYEPFGFDYYTTTNGYTTKKFLNNYIKFSTVKEKIKNNGFTKYYYTDILSNPDSSSYNIYPSTGIKDTSIVPTFKPLTEKQDERGKLFLKKVYDRNNNLLKKEQYFYKNNFSNSLKKVSNDCSDCKIYDQNYYVKIAPFGSSTNINGNNNWYVYQPVLPYLPSKVITTDYLDNGKSITTEKKLTYNEALSYWHPLPIKEETISNGSTVTNETLYNYDLLRKTNCGTNCTDNTSVGGKLATYKAMADNNVLAPIVSISTNQNNKKSLTESVYQKNPLNQNQFNVTSNKVSLLNTTIDPNNLAGVSTITVRENQLFDDKGNLLQFNEKGGLPTTIIYGYNQSLPIAEIKGATYGQVMSAFGLAQDAKAYLNLDIVKKSNLDKDDATEATLISAMNAFKNNASLNNYLIITKTYNPLIGVSSESTPTGQRTYYKYDENNQLVKILDHNKNILQEFKYNYGKRKYYNEALTISLFKNDCSEGSFTDPIIHVIPSNKYVSYISVNDANEIAKKEEEKLNQDYANKNGTCTSFTCKFNQGEFIYDFDYSIEKTSIMNEVRLQIGFLLTLTDLKNYDWSKEVKIGRLTGSCVPLKNQYFKFNFGETLIIGYIDREGNIIINSIKLRAENFYPLDIKYYR